MAIRDLAERLVEANRSGALDALLANDYAADAVSVEAMAGDPERGREAKGIEAIRAKHAWWNENMDVQEADVEGPFMHGDDRFAVIYSMSAVNRASGETMNIREVAVYQAAGDKIVREEFYYTM